MTKPINNYYDEERMAASVATGRHREVIGGLWEEIGAWQYDLMIAAGLQPHHRMLDVGCGTFRGGVRFVPYLEPSHYYGVDLSAALIEGGYQREMVGGGLSERLPLANLHATQDFDCNGFGVSFDFALAVSVFTHLPLNHIRLALHRVCEVLREGGTFVFTYFTVPADVSIVEPWLHDPGGIRTTTNSDPFHYRLSDIRHAAKELPVTIEPMPFRTHPRDQQVLLMRRNGSSTTV